MAPDMQKIDWKPFNRRDVRMEMLIYSTAICTLVNLALLSYVLRYGNFRRAGEHCDGFDHHQDLTSAAIASRVYRTSWRQVRVEEEPKQERH